MLETGLLSDHDSIGVAVSGGSDSTALLVLMVEALGPEKLRAVTVNHGLRRAAIEEAESVASLCQKLGVTHKTITLDLKDGSDLQARARSARYSALTKWANTQRVGAIALGHTQNDVAETFLMRLARGSGVDGLAQMPAKFERDGVVFLRPILASCRDDLQNMLRARDVNWSEDPSNLDLRFTRVQMRKAQPRLDALGLTAQRLSQTAQWMRAASDVLEQAAETWIADHAWAEHGDAVFDLSALENALEETAGRVLTRALCNISGNPYRPRLVTLQELLKVKTATTLHGCLAYQHKDTLRITREFNAILQGDTRWTITGPLTPDQTVKPLGEDGLKQVPLWKDTALLPRRSLLSSPAIWQKNTLIAAPIAQPDPVWSATVPNPLHLPK